MDERSFSRFCKGTVAQYVNNHTDKTDDAPDLTMDDVYIIWMCKALQNNKAILSTTRPDGMLYEVTYNGDKNEAYVDAYKKWENFVIKC